MHVLAWILTLLKNQPSPLLFCAFQFKDTGFIISDFLTFSINDWKLPRRHMILNLSCWKEIKLPTRPPAPTLLSHPNTFKRQCFFTRHQCDNHHAIFETCEKCMGAPTMVSGYVYWNTSMKAWTPTWYSMHIFMAVYSRTVKGDEQISLNQTITDSLNKMQCCLKHTILFPAVGPWEQTSCRIWNCALYSLCRSKLCGCERMRKLYPSAHPPLFSLLLPTDPARQEPWSAHQYRCQHRIHFYISKWCQHQIHFYISTDVNIRYIFTSVQMSTSDTFLHQ